MSNTIKAIRRASREQVKGFNLTTRIVPNKRNDSKLNRRNWENRGEY